MFHGFDALKGLSDLVRDRNILLTCLIGHTTLISMPSAANKGIWWPLFNHVKLHIILSRPHRDFSSSTSHRRNKGTVESTVEKQGYGSSEVFFFFPQFVALIHVTLPPLKDHRGSFLAHNMNQVNHLHELDELGFGLLNYCVHHAPYMFHQAAESFNGH